MGATPKVCGRCGQDCSARPRVKDGQGRYTCRACLRPEELAALGEPKRAGGAGGMGGMGGAGDAALGAGGAAAAQGGAGLPGSMRTTRLSALGPPAPVNAGPVSASAVARRNGEVVIPAAAEDDAPLSLADLERSATAAQLVCPSCQSSVAHGAALCVQCGYDLNSGKHLATARGAEQDRLPERAPAYGKCPKCKYDLKGLKQPRCPECGTVVLKKDHREHMAEYSKREARWAYVKPLIQMGAATLVTGLFFAARDEPEQFGWYVAGYLIQVPFGCLAFFACCLLWMGFDAPMHLTALRLAGVYAVSEGVAQVMSIVPVPFITWIAWLILYAGLLAESLDVDFDDAIYVALFSLLIKIAVFVAIVAYLMQR